MRCYRDHVLSHLQILKCKIIEEERGIWNLNVMATSGGAVTLRLLILKFESDKDCYVKEHVRQIPGSTSPQSLL